MVVVVVMVVTPPLAAPSVVAGISCVVVDVAVLTNAPTGCTVAACVSAAAAGVASADGSSLAGAAALAAAAGIAPGFVANASSMDLPSRKALIAIGCTNVPVLLPNAFRS